MRVPWERPKNQTLAEILRFVDAGEVSLRLNKLCIELGRMQLRYAAVRLVSWLECQADPNTAERPVEERTLNVDLKYQWCQTLLTLLAEHEDLGRFFHVRGGELVWNDAVSFEEQLALARQVSRRKRNRG
ncbi:MAG: hypothetical protein QM758_18235 [Armatimonas sp.]